MTGRSVLRDARWVVEHDGRRYLVTEISTEPVLSTLPRGLGPTVLLAPLVVGVAAAVAAVLQPDRVLILITSAALLGSVVAAVAASMLFGATLSRRPPARSWPAGSWPPAPPPAVRHLRSPLPALDVGEVTP